MTFHWPEDFFWYPGISLLVWAAWDAWRPLGLGMLGGFVMLIAWQFYIQRKKEERND